MNVLVYGAPDSPALSLLRSALLPHYAVQPVSAQALAGQPWHVNCALLVVPRPGELSGGKAISAIQSYVQNGGAFLGLSAGATLSPTAASGVDPVLQFYSRPGRYLRFDSAARQDASADPTADVEDLAGNVVRGVPLDPNNTLAGFAGEAGVQVVLRYAAPASADARSAPSEDACAAAIQLPVGAGRVAVVAPDLGSPSRPPAIPSASTQSSSSDSTTPSPHVSLLHPVLASLGLRLPDSPAAITLPRPQPQFLTANPGTAGVISRITRSLAVAQAEEQGKGAAHCKGAPAETSKDAEDQTVDTLASQLSVWEDSEDTFYFWPLAGAGDAVNAAQDSHGADTELKSDQDSQEKKASHRHIVLCPDGALPSRELTPNFDLKAYYEALEVARGRAGGDNGVSPWPLGDALIYGEAVTSTQTLLERNPTFRWALPPPIVSLAYAQLSGRGRGGNVWLSPAGCLQFSVLLRVPLSKLPAQKLVFVQYLFALAVAEACEEEGVLGRHGRKVRIKWPNDVYAEVGDDDRGQKQTKKIGGILVNTGFNGPNADVIIGSGLNVLNAPPIPSLAQLLPDSNIAPPTLERTAATILARFDVMWTQFVAGGGSFEPFLDRYLARWLHSDQLVTITTVDPPLRARIVGITEHGLLRAMPESGGGIGGRYGAGSSRGGSEGQFIDLQPDGNSFDIMSGMIKAKR
ncbi:class II aaRS and biotin synthetase [Schizophyllum commune H4-8]|uniref:BPL/LPL catalytic domain-containing protein n=1 Tax=Schizophyllum commune (strain H4-8 / FGSC 9210) TaxID=578458 RepID=D8PZQ7_SCHCM|nr:class II aaRS and biotin synthetase [Schizophyllum commune H4-8]KAI5896480.1 class II aaRS and biotin synthetase [Schizophyllum commune H4-8]